MQKPLHHGRHIGCRLSIRPYCEELPRPGFEPRTALLEARNDHPFHHRGLVASIRAEGKGFEPSSRLAGTALAERPGQPYPATFRFVQWTHRESNPDLQTASLMSSRWTMSPFRTVDQPGSRTPISWLQARRLSVGRAARVVEFLATLKVRPGFEPGLPPYRGGVPPKTPTDQIQSDPGWSRTISFLGVVQAS